MNKSELELTVVVPVSRMAGKLDLFKKWILFAQDKPIFVVVIHDWRDEETESELVNFLYSLPNEKAKFISGKFGSPGATRNQAREFVQTNWVAYWDSDDLPNVDAVLAAIGKSEKGDEVLIGSFEAMDLNKGTRRTYSLPMDWRLGVATNPGLWRMIFRRELLEKMKFSDLLMGEDQLFIANIDVFSRNTRVFHEIFYAYQIMVDQQATRSRNSLKDLKRCLTQFSEAISEVTNLNKDYYQIMYLKQIFSSIRHLPLEDRRFAWRKLLDFVKDNGVLNTLRYFAKIIHGR